MCSFLFVYVCCVFPFFPLAVLSCMLTSIRTALFVWANRLKWVNFALFSDLFLARHSLVTANDGLLSLQISCTWVITKHMYHHGLPSFNCVCVFFGAIDTTWIFLSILHSLVFCNWLVFITKCKFLRITLHVTSASLSLSTFINQTVSLHQFQSFISHQRFQTQRMRFCICDTLYSFDGRFFSIAFNHCNSKVWDNLCFSFVGCSTMKWFSLDAWY